MLVNCEPSFLGNRRIACIILLELNFHCFVRIEEESHQSSKNEETLQQQHGSEHFLVERRPDFHTQAQKVTQGLFFLFFFKPQPAPPLHLLTFGHVGTAACSFSKRTCMLQKANTLRCNVNIATNNPTSVSPPKNRIQSPA